jgi:hypothetical protein
MCLVAARISDFIGLLSLISAGSARKESGSADDSGDGEQAPELRSRNAIVKWPGESAAEGDRLLIGKNGKPMAKRLRNLIDRGR